MRVPYQLLFFINKLAMNRVFFSADQHFGHTKMLEMFRTRPFASELDIEAHDEYIIQQWNNTVDKHDDVYILGDFSLRPTSETRRILERLKGRKYLCPGNHDASLRSLGNYFVKVQQIMAVRFKVSRFPYLANDVKMILCHYPLLEWDGIREGVLHLHGHCHGTLQNSLSPFRYDVGIDATKKVLTPLEEIVGQNGYYTE